ncbi:unnamed protein product [Auanema sp. JU1783]|nr:unnamed protein product [Auanema sp. JU1783]
MEQPKSVAGPLTVTGGGLKRKSTCPFGENYYGKLSKLLLSNEPDALDQMKEMLKTIEAAQQQPSDEFWDSGDEITNEATLKALMHKKTQLEKPKPPKSDNPEKKKLLSFGMKSKEKKREDDDSETEKVCSICESSTSTPNNLIVCCEPCQTNYHIKCHQPNIDLKQATDLGWIFICSNCDVKSPKSRSASPKPNMVNRQEEKKPSSLTNPTTKSSTETSSLFEQYKKKKERQQQMLRGSLKK